MYLLAYRSSKHETTGFQLNFILHGILGFQWIFYKKVLRVKGNTIIDCISHVKKKLKDLHKVVRKRVDIKSSQTKTWYDQKARKIQFSVGQKVWFL